MKDQLDSMGYQILEEKIDDNGYFEGISAKKRSSDIYFVTEREKMASYLDTYLCEVKAIGSSNVKLRFILSEKDIDSPIAVGKGNILDKFVINSEGKTDSDSIEEFIYNERIFHYLSELVGISINHQLSFIANGEKCLIKITSDCNMLKTLSGIPFFEALFEILQQGDTLNDIIKGTKNYICLKCSNELKFGEIICKNCNTKAPICVICFRGLQENTITVVSNCCQSYIHQTEFKMWMQLEKKCPYCKAYDPTVHIVDIN